MAEQSSADYRGTLGRYALFGEIAAGGMATVHLARMMGSVGFARTVAIKRLHPHLAKDPDFVNMFLEEARLAARVRHPNVVATLDVVDDDNELFLVMEYVAGESLSRLIRKTREAGNRVPVRYVVGVMCGVLEGLHAAHEATSERGLPLGLVHRDVSPQNVHVGLDGVARVLDFGIAKATNRVQETRADQIKGKVAYMAPEQLAKGAIDRRADVYSASVVLWEALTSTRLFQADDVPSLVYAIMNDEIRRPSELIPELPRALDDILLRGLDRDAAKRWPSARDMAVALEAVLPPAPPREIGEWVRDVAGDMLAWRTELVHRIESETATSIPPPLRGAEDSALSFEPNSGVVPNTNEVDRDEEFDEAEGGRATVYESAADADAALDKQHASSRIRFGALAAALLVLGAGLLGFRLFQLRQADTGTNLPPSTTTAAGAEQAIGLEVARSAPSAMASTPPPRAQPKPEPKSDVSPPRSTSSAPTPAPATSDCDDKFYVDARGMRHPKPQCFKR